MSGLRLLLPRPSIQLLSLGGWVGRCCKCRRRCRRHHHQRGNRVQIQKDSISVSSRKRFTCRPIAAMVVMEKAKAPGIPCGIHVPHSYSRPSIGLLLPTGPPATPHPPPPQTPLLPPPYKTSPVSSTRIIILEKEFMEPEFGMDYRLRVNRCHCHCH